MVTIKDIAREAGYSVTTVSRALSGYDDVAAKTRARIEEVARSLDYHPNVAARSLQATQADALGLLIPSTLHRSYDAFWLEFIGGVAAACAESGFDLSLSAGGGESVSEAFRRWVRGHRVDGVIVCDVLNDDPRVDYLARHTIPFVAFGRTADPNRYSYIDVDGGAGVFQAVAHLTDLGHERIAYVGVDSSFGFSRFRADGYRAGLNHASLPFDLDLVIEGQTNQTVVAAVERLFHLQRPPTAIVAAADFIALSVLAVARQVGWAVPDDLSLVVFDDNLLVQQADPPLTAISQPNRWLGEEAARLLVDRIRKPDGPLVQRLVGPTLKIRASTYFPNHSPRPLAAPRKRPPAVPGRDPRRGEGAGNPQHPGSSDAQSAVDGDH